jgi:hypothetical protein
MKFISMSNMIGKLSDRRTTGNGIDGCTCRETPSRGRNGNQHASYLAETQRKTDIVRFLLDIKYEFLQCELVLNAGLFPQKLNFMRLGVVERSIDFDIRISVGHGEHINWGD